MFVVIIGREELARLKQSNLTLRTFYESLSASNDVINMSALSATSVTELWLTHEVTS